MSESFKVKNPAELKTLATWLAAAQPGKVLAKAYVYPSFKRGVELINIRLVTPENEVFSYNLPSGQYGIFQGKVREGNFQWAGKPNKIEALQNYVVGNGGQYHSQTNPLLINPFLRNVNPTQIALPQSLWEAGVEPTSGYFDNVMSGDILRIDNKFMKVSNAVKENLKQIRANLALINGDLETVKDHDLFFGFNLDKENLSLFPSLTRIAPQLPEGGELTLTVDKLNSDDWSHLSPLGQTGVQTIIDCCNNVTASVAEFMAEANGSECLHDQAHNLIMGMFVMLTQAGHMVYTFNYDHAKEMVDGVANDILTRLAAVPGIIGLDINSWKVYEYTDPTDPHLMAEPNLEEEIYNRYTDSFIQALYGQMLHCGSPLLRPYTRKVLVSEEHINDHKIGSVRVEPMSQA